MSSRCRSQCPLGRPSIRENASKPTEAYPRGTTKEDGGGLVQCDGAGGLAEDPSRASEGPSHRDVDVELEGRRGPARVRDRNAEIAARERNRERRRLRGARRRAATRAARDRDAETEQRRENDTLRE